jgi:hypothetical protein
MAAAFHPGRRIQGISSLFSSGLKPLVLSHFGFGSSSLGEVVLVEKGLMILEKTSLFE